MILAAIPPVARMRGTVRVPGSKSHTNRALMLASMGRGRVRVRGVLDCGDSDSLVACLRASGATIEKGAGDLLVIPPSGAPREAVLDARDSGTACRFLAARAAATAGFTASLTGSARLRERPIGPLVEALRGLGGDVAYLGREGFPPLEIRGRRLEGGDAAVDASMSSQFASALLLAAPLMRNGIRLRLEGREVSRDYITTTLEMLTAAGIRWRAAGSAIEVEPGPVSAEELPIPGDFSSAVPLAGAVAVRGGEVRLENLEWPSRQADASAFRVLEAMGLALEASAGGLDVSGRARSPAIADASGFPDAVPVLCAIASRAPGESVFSGVEHLRLKESDRIEAIEEMLAAGGASSTTHGGEIRVLGTTGPFSLAPPVFPTRADHRLVMASTLLCLDRGGFVEEPRSVDKSYPGFFRDLFRGILA
ncbi:MAG: 3-phosphoshikimate 1-carboxyvinyltransferase [Thermoanaerobaculia bacterium]